MKKNTENFRKYKTLALKQNERTEEYAYEKKTKNLIFLSIDICRRLWPAMATGIQFPITISEPCTERFRWTKRRIDFYKFDNLQIKTYLAINFSIVIVLINGQQCVQAKETCSNVFLPVTADSESQS